MAKKSKNSLIDQDEYSLKAESQRKSIFETATTKASNSLTAQEWQKAAAVLLLVMRGVYLPMLGRHMVHRLRCKQTRDECEGVIRRYKMTLETAAEIAGYKSELRELLERERLQALNTQS